MGRQGPYKKQYRNMRGMGILYMQAAQPYTLKSSGIRTFKDLKGKTLSVGARPAPCISTSSAGSKPMGLIPRGFRQGAVPARQRSYGSGQDRTGGRRRGTVVHPLAADLELSILRPVHILEFLPGARADMMQKYPQYLPTTIEKGAYNGIDQPIETVGTGAMFACRADLPDDLVYEIVKTVYSQEGVDYLGNVIAALKSMSPNLAVSYKPIPLHPGAERYFREIGLIKD
ncbi:MAG: TAXI family TRAP transporter solute-binding subunit [Bilophila wadsworthia]